MAVYDDFERYAQQMMEMQKYQNHVASMAALQRNSKVRPEQKPAPSEPSKLLLLIEEQ